MPWAIVPHRTAPEWSAWRRPCTNHQSPARVPTRAGFSVINGCSGPALRSAKPRKRVFCVTGGGRFDIEFADGSSVTLGENARLVLDEFVLPEGGGAGNQVLRSIAGALRFVGGAVDQSKAGATRIVTPIATMTVRGTEFFAGPID